MRRILNLLFVLVLAVSFMGCSTDDGKGIKGPEQSSSTIEDSSKGTNEEPVPVVAGKEESENLKGEQDEAASCDNKSIPVGQLKVSFIDISQGDSIIIQNGVNTMLIDGGSRFDSDYLISYLEKLGINKIDYLIGTHPHDDHIGGLSAIIDNFNIGTVYMSEKSADTNVYQDLQKSLKDKDIKAVFPSAGTTFNVGEAICTVMAPIGDGYDSMDDYSIVIKMVYGSTSFLFAGDAGSVSENEMLSRNYDISADLLKISNHESNSSTSNSFLNKVKPKYAVTSAGSSNTGDAISRLRDVKVKVYRTEESGAIIATSDKENISFTNGPPPI